MINILLVDDDLSFLKSFKKMPIDGAKIHSFSSAIDALKEINTINPEIIISDVKMPGVHGIDFSVIAKSIIKPKEFIYVSANSKEEIEKTYGPLKNSQYFRKPLKIEFYDFLDEVVEKANKQNKDITDVKNSKPSMFKTRVANLQNLKKSIIEWHDLNLRLLKMNISDDIPEGPLDSIYHSQKHNLELIQEIFELSSQEFNSFCNQIIGEDMHYSRRYESYIIDQFKDKVSVQYSPSVFINFENKEYLIQSIYFSKEETDDFFSIKINGKKTQEKHSGNNDIAKINCENQKRYTLLMTLSKQITRRHLAFYWDILDNKKQHLEFPNGYRTLDGKTSSKIFRVNNRYINEKNEIINIADENQIPDLSILCSKKKVTIKKLGHNEFEISVGGSIVEAPTTKMINEVYKNQDKEKNSEYLKMDELFRICWEIAGGKENWEISPNLKFSLKDISKTKKKFGLF